MTKTTLALAAATLLGGLTLGLGSASALPAGPAAIQAGAAPVTQVRMMSTHDRMMERRMMKKRMMHRRMMKKRMMHRM
ncbi:hypothetical protein G3T14_00545 [Methylobacterium sp. BTF04]|uniref:hypothetical protein n=1 Tax=Methylobacterium sp. BTF04 TaxID=2708300 RepID=UPI0013D5C5D8|nr:hypothetical protein [Methylobacterium sp. BTF04]NEU10616.1 hypothetical protein [Methylobacterium sp. BTF04]